MDALELAFDEAPVDAPSRHVKKSHLGIEKNNQTFKQAALSVAGLQQSAEEREWRALQKDGNPFDHIMVCSGFSNLEQGGDVFDIALKPPAWMKTAEGVGADEPCVTLMTDCTHNLCENRPVCKDLP